MTVETKHNILLGESGLSFPKPLTDNRDGIVVVQEVAEFPSAMRGGVILLGNFDGFHRGHQSLLAAANEVVTRHGVPVGVMSSEPHPRTFFAPETRRFRLTGYTTKKEIFRRFGFNFMFAPRFDAPMASTTPEDFVSGVLVEGLGVSHVVVGDDFRFGRQRRGCPEMLCRLGAFAGFGVTRVAAMMANERPYSSSLVRELLGAGDARGAAQVLGYDWFFDADIANADVGFVRLDVPDQLVIPMDGVYAVTVSAIGAGPRRTCKLYVQGDMMFIASSGHCPGVMHLPGRVRVRVLERI